MNKKEKIGAVYRLFPRPKLNENFQLKLKAARSGENERAKFFEGVF